MQKNPVSCTMRASFTLPDNVMVMPSRDLGNFLLAHRTYPVLFLPEMPQLPSSRQVLCHFDAEALFKIHFPYRVKGIGIPVDEGMSLDFHIHRSSDVDEFLVSLLILNFSGEHPVVRAVCGEILLFYP